jgi:hypothetical protein
MLVELIEAEIRSCRAETSEGKRTYVAVEEEDGRPGAQRLVKDALVERARRRKDAVKLFAVDGRWPAKGPSGEGWSVSREM